METRPCAIQVALESFGCFREGSQGKIRINAFVTDRAHFRNYMTIRDRLFDGPAPATTLWTVTGLASAWFKLDIG